MGSPPILLVMLSTMSPSLRADIARYRLTDHFAGCAEQRAQGNPFSLLSSGANSSEPGRRLRLMPRA